MAQLWTTGPALLFVGITPVSGTLTAGTQVSRITNPVNTTPAFLGTAEFSPEIHERPGWEPAFNDFGGSRIPFDMMYEGVEAFTFVDLSRWNENIRQQLSARPRTVNVNPANPQEGTNFFGDIGAFMIAEGLSYTLYVVFPYAIGKPAYLGLTPGYRFPFSWLEGPDEHRPLGTKPHKKHLVFHHLRGFDPATGRFLLYDHLIPSGILNLVN